MSLIMHDHMDNSGGLKGISIQIVVLDSLFHSGIWCLK